MTPFLSHLRCSASARLFAALVLTTAFGLPGCAQDGRNLTLQVLDRDDQPVEDAHIVAAFLGGGATPLPVSLKTLDEMKWAPGPGGFTDEDGTLRLLINHDQTWQFKLDAPAFSPLANDGPWVWHLAPGSDELLSSPGRARRSDDPYTLTIVR